MRALTVWMLSDGGYFTANGWWAQRGFGVLTALGANDAELTKTRAFDIIIISRVGGGIVGMRLGCL